jgi:thiol:disulfide interchange protein
MNFRTAAALGLAWVGAWAFGQAAPSPDLSLELPRGAVAAGTEVDAKLTVRFAPGFHAYQNPPSDPSNIPLSVEAGSDGTRVVSARYPKGIAKPFPGFDVPLAMYEGTVSVPLRLALPDKDGEHTVELVVRYQICDDSNCWPPTQAKVAGKVRLSRAGAVADTPTAPPPGGGGTTAASGPAKVLSFLASTDVVKQGGKVVVSWNIAGAGSAKLSDGTNEYPVAAVGTQTFTIVRDTTLVISATAADGSAASRSLTVKVEPAPETAAGELTPAPQDPVPGQAGPPPAAGADPEPGSGDATADAIVGAMRQGLVPYLLLAFLAGIAALATPCVWPMIPITVSFFSKRGTGDKKDTRGALAYSLGIMATFTMLGVAVSAIFGAAGIQRIAANVWVNIGLTLVFVVLALALFGVFDFALPQSFVDKFSKGSREKQGLLGPILMGVTFTLTSFTCTVPFVGTLLVTAAKGDFLFPILGMLAFSLAFAVPFFLLALFPQWLATLPKSGSWLGATKGYMGFLELAAALKFLSNVDIAWNWGLLTKEAFLAVWVVIFAMAGFWLAGAVRIPHADGDNPKIGPWRRGFGLVNIALAGYLLTAINGAPLGQMVGFLPPDPYPGSGSQTAVAGKPGDPTGHREWVKDYDEAVRLAKAEGKLLLLNFTGDFCVNCRVMENTVFPDPEVSALMDKAVNVWLVTDREDETSRKNSELRERLTQSVTNPVYVIQHPDGKVLAVLGGATQGPKPFVAWLQKGLATL